MKNVYLIQVEATRIFTRTYTVEAEHEWAALAAYQDNDEAVLWCEDDVLEDFECEENGDTVCVYSDDDTQTLLIDVASDIDED